MRFRYASSMSRRVLFLVLAPLAASAAWAGPAHPDVPGTAWQVPPHRLAANFDPGMPQQRLRDLPPEEREAALRELRQRWQDAPPEERRKRREEWLKHKREDQDAARPGGVRPERESGFGFGQGYESRQFPPPDPGDFGWPMDRRRPPR
jgi:hypothetical protein